MNTNQKRALLIALVATYITLMKAKRGSRSIRKQVRLNTELDIQAIEAAKNVCLNRIHQGKYQAGDIDVMMEDFNTEIAFQKIAIRLEK